VQWADEASISVLDLLLRRHYKNIFFMWSCCDDEMEVDHPIWQLIHNVRSIGIHTTIVALKSLEEEELNTTMSDLLCLSPRIVRPL
jgi:predicted ATPase